MRVVWMNRNKALGNPITTWWNEMDRGNKAVIPFVPDLLALNRYFMDNL